MSPAPPASTSRALRFLWPILDDSATVNQLVAGADPDIAQTSLTGCPVWTVAVKRVMTA